MDKKIDEFTSKDKKNVIIKDEKDFWKTIAMTISGVGFILLGRVIGATFFVIFVIFGWIYMVVFPVSLIFDYKNRGYTYYKLCPKSVKEKHKRQEEEKKIREEEEAARKRKKQEEERRIAEEERIRKGKIEFYRECVEKNVLDFSSNVNKQKAVLIAVKHGYKEDTSFDKYLSEAKALAEPIIHVEKEKELSDLREKEDEECAKLSQYSELFGREKRLGILKDRYSECCKAVRDLSFGNELMRDIALGKMQKEHDWAVHGGIASGIAGGAAGLATAANIQNKNAEIRAQNQTIMNTYASVSMATDKQVREYWKKIDALSAEISETKIKLVADIPAEEIMKNLHLSVSKVEISKTGNCKIRAGIAIENRDITKNIFENLEAVVDGTIAANVIQNGKVVATALLVLPMYGIVSVGRSGVYYIDGMGKGTADKNLPYEIEFAPYKLWIMEK